MFSDSSYREWQRISQLHANKPFITKLLGPPLEVLDARAFTYLYNELFRNRIYDFSPSTPNPLIIDCGANIGLSIIFFKITWSHSRVIGFEPDPDVFRVCSNNIKSFGFEDVQLIPKALYKANSIQPFKKGLNDEGRIIPQGKSSGFCVETVLLSDFITGPVDFLKLDIEGAETEVLRECAPKLSLIDKLFIEYHSYENEPQTLQDILGILTGAKFKYYISTPYVINPSPYQSLKDNGRLNGVVNIMAKKLGSR